MPAALVLTQVWYLPRCSWRQSHALFCSALWCSQAPTHWACSDLPVSSTSTPVLPQRRGEGHRRDPNPTPKLADSLAETLNNVAISGTLLGGIGSMPDANASQQFLCNGQKILSTSTTSGSSREECVSLGRIRAGGAGRDKSSTGSRHLKWDGRKAPTARPQELRDVMCALPRSPQTPFLLRKPAAGAGLPPAGSPSRHR